MASDGGSMELKQLCCYFHVGGHFKSNSEGIAQYIGGNVKMRNIKEGIKLESLREMIASWLGVDCNNCDIKYTIMFDEKVLMVTPKLIPMFTMLLPMILMLMTEVPLLMSKVQLLITKVQLLAGAV